MSGCHFCGRACAGEHLWLHQLLRELPAIMSMSYSRSRRTLALAAVLSLVKNKGAETRLFEEKALTLDKKAVPAALALAKDNPLVAEAARRMISAFGTFEVPEEMFKK